MASPSVPVVSESAPKTSARTILAGAIGNVLEWYDFALFGFVAPVISAEFFPSENRLAALLNTFGVFALGFFMRPIGGMIFGHVGDRYGRRKALGLSVLMMAVPTTLVGLLPTYAQVGVAAPVLLTLIRVLQGLSVGGEYTGSMSFLAEHAAPGQRALASSWINVGAGVGCLLGSGVAALMTAVTTTDQMASWGWRVPFLLTLISGPLALWLRLGLDESPYFEALEKEGKVAAAPVQEALRRDRLAMLYTVGIALMQSIGYYLPWVWLATWLSEINHPTLSLSAALLINTIGMTLVVTLTPVAGWLADRLGRKAVFLTGTLMQVALTYPLFVLMGQGSFTAVLIGQGIFALSCAAIQGTTSVMFAELFPTRTRYSGMGLAYNLTLAVFGGTTPLVATWLVHATGDVRAPAYYLIGASLISALTALGLRDRCDQNLE
jgi:MHS family proline/betaine transporter-like MFS transporter